MIDAFVADKEKDRARSSELTSSQHNYANPITPGASLVYWTDMVSFEVKKL